MALPAHRPSLRERRHSSHASYYEQHPPAYKPDVYEAYTAYTPVALPWAHYPAPVPNAPQPQPQPHPEGFGYFSWPSTSTVDSLSDTLDLPKLASKPKKGGIFSSLRRKAHVPDGHLHRLLLHTRPCALAWDVRAPPASALHAGAPGAALSPADRAASATSPPRARMRITCELLPWTVDVRATGGAGVSVGDVLDALWAALQRRVRRSEWLIAQESLQERVVRAFAWRCYAAGRPPGVEEAQGPKRVDWLLKKTVWRGLSHGEDDTWIVHLSAH